MSQSRGAPSPESPPDIPLWVKVLGIIAVALIVLLVILHLAGLSPVGHGP